ncbi:MAG: amidohydrolase family protein [Comamonadaceae bacterium]|nr:amidohydrolase family protein [Comamonadaceae bacterium]
MQRVLIHNIGEFYSGDLAQPSLPVKSIAIAQGRIEALDPASHEGFDTVIDAAGLAVVPGLIDGHVHPVAGQWTPTQDAIGWVSNYLHGGTTSMLSAGELHFPGLDYGSLTPDLVTSLAEVTANTFANDRACGVKLHAGTALLIPGMTEAHFDRLAKAGAKLVKFLFYPFAQDPEEAKRYVKWARERGLRSKVHTGGVSRSGVSQICGFEILSWLQPDIAAHISGGPIPMCDEDLDRVIDELEFPLEICSSGNYASGHRAVRRLVQRGRLDRLTLGSDTPGGTGVIPRGAWRNILFLSSMCGLSPAEAIAVATGNTGRAHGLEEGILAPGRPADLALCGPVEGSAGTSLADAVAHGDLPGITHVLIDGQAVVSGRSRQTPPPRLRPVMACCGPDFIRSAA